MARPPSKRGRGIALPEGLSEVLFEFRPVGRILRVTAIDPKTGTEVIMVADPKYGEATIKRLAARKLAYVISKKKSKQSDENGSDMLV
ncbi:MAG: hypothetical protein KAI27_06570 [Rhodospirillaceae bacterium]|nr:hypothetical protein [Rhodospirillaceae bacterium]